MKIKNYVALFLCLSLVLGLGSVVAYAEKAVSMETEATEATEAVYIPIETVEEITEEEYVAEASRVRKQIDFVNPMVEGESETQASSTQDIEKAQWDSLFSDAFGREYYSYFMEYGEGANLLGNTNALEINNTDLHLPGKNGLDLNIIRRHNNHGVGHTYALIYEDWHTINQKRNFYNMSYGEDDSIYVACYTEDDFYEYLKKGCYISEIPTDKLRSIKYNDETIKYYLVEDIHDVLTEASEEAIHLTYTEGDGSVFSVVIKTDIEEDFEIYWYAPLMECNRILSDWYFIMPAISLEETWSEYTSDDTYYIYTEYMGMFRDINNEVYSLEAFSEIKKKKADGEDILREYTFSATPNDNNSLLFKSFYDMQAHEKGFEYNFYVENVNDGYTYYFYDISGTGFARMLLVGIEDEFGNIITYHYDENRKLSKIVDTYGKEVLLTYGDNSITVSYDNGGKAFSYAIQENVEEINNGSILEGKAVNKFIYTNEAGEETTYYYRNTELPVVGGYNNIRFADVNDNYFITPASVVEKNKNSNIERIVYPNGLVTDYSYSRVYQVNESSDVVIGQWAVSKIENTVNGKKETDTFTFEGNERVTINHVGAGGLVTKSSYDKEDRLTLVVASEDGTESGDYYKETYTYENNRLVEKTVYSNGKQDNYLYDYVTNHKNLIDSVTVNGYQTKYYYFSRRETLEDRTRTTYLNVPQKIVTYYDNNKKTHYTLTAELSDNGRTIASEELTYDDVVYGKTYYTYDHEGNVASVNKIIDDTNADGVVDESDESSKMNYTYSYADGILTVTLTKNDVVDFDGENVGNIVEIYEYDMYGNPLSYSDGNYNLTEIIYDNASRPVKYNFPEYTRRSVQYDIAGRTVIATDEREAQYKYTYDEVGRILDVQRLNNGWETLEAYSYDDAGRLVQKNTYRQADEGTKETYTYDIFNRVVEKKVYELPDELLYTENYTYTKSSSGFTIAVQTVGADGVTTATVKENYDKKGNLEKTQYITDEKTIKTLKDYDFLNRVISETDAEGNTVTYTYDVPGNVTTITYPDDLTATFSYDMLGRQVSSTDRAGNTSYFTYDTAGRVIRKVMPFDDTTTAETLYKYERNGNLTEEYVKTGTNTYRQTTYYYNGLNQLTSATQHSDRGNIATRYDYNQSGELAAFETGLSSYLDSMENHTLYRYDMWGNLIRVIDPMGYTETYTYDYRGNVLSKTDKNGETVTFEYNTFGLSGKSDGETHITNTYNGIGQLTGAQTTGKSQNLTSYTYDPFGNLETVTQGNSQQSYTYDDNGNVTGYTLTVDGELQSTETYAYDDMNRRTGQTVNGKAFSFTYDSNGNLTGRSVDGVLSETYRYNNAGLLTDVSNKEDWLSANYRPDGLKIWEINYTKFYTKDFVYDDFGRLTSDIYKSADTGETFYSNTYFYDSRGNCISMSTEEGSFNYTYDYNNRMLSRSKIAEGAETELVSWVYDQNGNTISQSTLAEGIPGIKQFEYDGFNRLTKYTDEDSVANYTYYADNLRATKNVNGTEKQFYWNGSSLAAETSGTEVKTYAYDLMGVAAVTSGADTTYFSKDTHNDIVLKLNASGEIMSSQYFDSFGNKNSPITEDEFGYTGEYMDAESGLIYLRNRYYDPENGRFINEDPVRDGLNWYVYCANNPVMFRDPWGLYYDDVAEAIGVIIDNKSRMMTSGTPSNEYWNAYSNILTAKQAIANDVVYIEDLSGMRAVLDPLINGDDNSISDLKAMQSTIEETGEEDAWNRKVDDFLVTGTMVVVGAVAIKAVAAGGAVSILSTTGKSSSIPTAYKSLEQGVNFSYKALQHMNETARHVPVQILIFAIKYGTATPDPRGTGGTMYYIDMVKNGKSYTYTLEVLYDWATNTIQHFKYYHK